MDQIGKYKKLREIGKGATSHVYDGYDEDLDRHVAVKVISAEISDDEGLRKRFEREATSAAGLNHPNIITVYDYGQEQDKLFMAMELLQGADLKQVLAEGRLKTLDEKLEIMEQICEGLAYAHTKGIVHRDLKPANIHLLPDKQVKIMDFGLARTTGSDMTRTGLVMGTPHYMSPEQVRGEHVDFRSDVFSLGAIFYELLTGKKPFDADSLHSVLYKVMQAEPQPLSDVVPRLPGALIQVVKKALARTSGERFGDAGEVHRFLVAAREAIAEGRGEEPLPGLSLPSPPAPRPSPAAASPAPPPPAPPVAGPLPRDGPGSSSSAVRRADRSSIARSRSIAPAPPPSASWMPYVLFGLVLAAAVLAGVLWARRGFAPGTADAPPSPSAQVDSLTRTLVETQVELARKKLDAGDFEDAMHQADRALKLDPGSADARKVFDEAKKIETEIQSSEADARAALAKRDVSGAAAGLWRLLNLAPDSPAAAEIASALNADMKPQAEEARRLMGEARQAAEKVQAKRVDSFREGAELARSADAALRAKDYGAAARDFMRARYRFLKAQR